MKRGRARNGQAPCDVARLWGSKKLKDRMWSLREKTGASLGAIIRFALSRVSDKDVLDSADTVRDS